MFCLREASLNTPAALPNKLQIAIGLQELKSKLTSPILEGFFFPFLYGALSRIFSFQFF